MRLLLVLPTRRLEAYATGNIVKSTEDGIMWATRKPMAAFRERTWGCVPLSAFSYALGWFVCR